MSATACPETSVTGYQPMPRNIQEEWRHPLPHTRYMPRPSHSSRFCVVLCFSVVLCILCFVSFRVLCVCVCVCVCVRVCVCVCVLYYCHRVATQLQLTNISYHIISQYITYHISHHIYHNIYIISYHTIPYQSHIISYIISHHIIYHIIWKDWVNMAHSSEFYTKQCLRCKDMDTINACIFFFHSYMTMAE